MQLEFITRAQNMFVELVNALKLAAQRCRRKDDIKLTRDIKRMEKLCEEFGRAQALSPGASPQGLRNVAETLNPVMKLAGRLAIRAIDADMVNFKELHAAYISAHELGALLRKHLHQMVNWHHHSSHRIRGIRVTKTNPLAAAQPSDKED